MPGSPDGTLYTFGGDEFVYVELSAAMSLPVHFRSLAITRRLAEEAIPGVEEIAPSNASYMVRVDPDRLHPRDLVARAAAHRGRGRRALRRPLSRRGSSTSRSC